LALGSSAPVLGQVDVRLASKRAPLNVDVGDLRMGWRAAPVGV
jgi:hypothetical protein